MKPIACFIIVTAVALFGPTHASAGTYTTRILSTDEPGWVVQGFGGAYSTEPLAIRAAAGSYAAGASRRWRYRSPNADLRIVGGRIVGTSSTPAASQNVLLRAGFAGGTAQTIAHSASLDTFDVGLPPVPEWIEFGLETTSTAGLSNSQTLIQISAFEVSFDDRAAPTAHLEAPGMGGPACLPLSVAATDSGGGLRRLAVSIDEASREVAAWDMPLGFGVSPGPASVVRTTCLPAAVRTDGAVTARVIATDVSGATGHTIIKIRSDLTPPTVNGVPSGTVDTGRLPANLTLADPSGIAGAEVWIDGSVRAGLGANASITIPRIAPGRHDLRITVRDMVGNEQTIARELTVIDTTPPHLRIETNEHDGILEALASDDDSSVDEDSWRVSVGGRRLLAQGSQRRVTSSFAHLAEGTHTILVEVRDQAGNEATRTVRVTIPEVLARGAGGVGELRIDGLPRRPVAVGSTVRLRLAATHGGVPLSARRVVALHGPRVIARDLTDARGAAEIRLQVDKPMMLQVGLEEGPRQQVVLTPQHRLTAQLTSSSTSVGHPVQLRGRVMGRARYVRIQTRIDGLWITVRDRIAVDARGRFKAPVTAAASGTFALRVVSVAGSGWAPGQSQVRSLAVRSTRRSERSTAARNAGPTAAAVRPEATM